MRASELRKIAMDFRRGVLNGRPSNDMCYAVAAPLAGMLSAVYGVACSLEGAWMEETPIGTTNHYFIRLTDGRILDPTADQFGLAPVYLGPMPAQYQIWMEAAR